MSEETTADTEAGLHPLHALPDNELAKEIGPESDADLHGDPDDPDPTPSPTEAGSMTSWRVAKALLTLRAQNSLAPRRGKASDGTIGDPSHKSRASDHNPWVRDGATGVVTAMDVTHSPDLGCDAGVLAAAIRAQKDPFVKYIIWNRKIANSSPIGTTPAWGLRDYTGRNPHDHHIHISVRPEPASYDSETQWTLPSNLASGSVA